MLTEKQMKVIQHAYKTVPFYAELCKKKEMDCTSFKCWEDIPTITKKDLVLRNDSFISAQYLALYMQKKLMYVHTSGSTGVCADVFWNLSDCKRSLLPLWRKRKKYYNINPHDKHCYFYTGRNIGVADIEREDRGFALGFCKSDLNDKKVVDIWKEMYCFKPVWMNLQPSMAMILSRVVEKYNLNPIPTLRYIEMTGEMLFPQMRKYIQEKMNVVIANQYGCNELNSLAFECPEGHMHCLEENAVIEILGEDEKPVPDGEEGEICITTLTNFAMPLVRYKIGDRGRFLSSKCQCGDKGKILQLTAGRNNDWVIDREGNYLNAYIFVRCVENVNKLFEHVILQFQVIQHDFDDFTINLVLDEECNPDEICHYFMENLWQSSLLGAKFNFQFYFKLMPDMKSGKLKWFISELNLNRDESLEENQ